MEEAPLVPFPAIPAAPAAAFTGVRFGNMLAAMGVQGVGRLAALLTLTGRGWSG